ncbi:MAG TPA: response regulator transcription factor [Sphingomonadaceae bacterium]|nr:response regulator transcription factor [Sphingomonadaceae bacterium]
MIRPILICGTAIAALAVLMAWMDYRHLARAWSTEFYVGAVAAIFVVLGIWVGNRLTPRARPAEFARNEAALAYLGISVRECEVLELLAAGYSNKLIARRLEISPNTVKTHVARLFEKLEATSRTQAIAKARELRLLP